MKRILPAISLIAVAATFFPSCSYDNIDEYYGSCDTLNITFSGVVDPILEINCKTCHFNGNVNTGINIADYEDVKKLADEGKLLGAIRHKAGFKAMPPNSKLDDCSIRKIEAWVNNGSQNNE